ncbi:acyl-(acyl-carrier-protein)--phospholipid O-acyltransferase [Methylocaldum marinum]|uniref:Acyl-(Acyl-carrier-protein)--phospholipid O-acyltransferase n=1 Tax=Methylocaldum marinum TaxID=1432792 RepID=A0A250KQB7_9GAMM|nr:AMP-binding protein [Methylocaldum marinum]BBA33787.1 acyl-(acyl-carrier-protein)--phospholipid O-acyltransferase [Methylocaldum marinum]
MIKTILRWILARLFRVKVIGLENYQKAGPRVLIAANHSSYLDPILLWAFLPDDVTFAINTRVAGHWWVRPALRFAKVFPMEPTQPLAVKALTHYLKKDRKAVVFPEGRITVTGALMKIYDGTGLIAEKSGATVLPIRLDGTQYTVFSRLHRVVRLRWFPPITLNILPPRKVNSPQEVTGPERRHQVGRMLSDLMSEMMFETSNYRRTVFSALLDARRIHGGGHRVLEDAQRKPLTYDRLIAQSLALGRKLAEKTEEGDAVGLLLPNLNSTVAAFFGLQVQGRIPAMLNFSAGTRSLLSSCTTANIKTVVTARRFVATAKLEETVKALSEKTRVLYLEDLGRELGVLDKTAAFLAALAADYWYRSQHRPDDPAAILFTSGSEGEPKGVVLSHANLLANREQLAARFDFNAQDIILNVLPVFHAFGLTAGTLLPLLSGMRLFLYPSPLHYRIIPELAYDLNATILFGTNTFLHGYAKHAHPYDFYSVRYVFAGAEKLQADTRRLWMEKFGLRVLEGYGATETSPVLSANTPMYYREGTVGRFFPGIQWRLEEVPGVVDGGRLHVAGPNVMLGYLRPERPGELDPPASNYGIAWYDTGDIVRIDEEGFIAVLGRVKRFAKIGGEMVSLTAVEELAARIWPGQRHAALALSDARKGEKIVLATEFKNADRAELVARAQLEGLGELHLPKDIRVFKELPLLATGKVDYPALTGFFRERSKT